MVFPPAEYLEVKKQIVRLSKIELSAYYVEIIYHSKNKGSNFRPMVRASDYLYEPFNTLFTTSHVA